MSLMPPLMLSLATKLIMKRRGKIWMLIKEAMPALKKILQKDHLLIRFLCLHYGKFCLLKLNGD